MKIGKTRNAFTLVELMIVVVIIAILAGLTTIGTRIAIRKAKDATVALSLEQLSMAIERYKNEIGEYPPDFTDLDAVARHIRKRWPRSIYTTTDVQTFLSEAASQFYVPEDPKATPFGPASALVFWLGGLPDKNGKPQGFYLSPTHPLGGEDISSQREEPRFDFPDGTIVSGTCSFSRSENPRTRFEGPAFQPGKDDSKPVIYFCASAPAESILDANMETENAAYQMLDDKGDAYVKNCVFKNIGRAVPYSKGLNSTGYSIWHEPERFQLIHPGQDGLFSGTNGDKTYGQDIISIIFEFDRDTKTYELEEVFPLAPYPCTELGTTELADNTLTEADDDNIVSFAEGGTLESLYPQK